MKRTIAVLAISLFFLPSVSMAAGLTYQQASSIIVLLQVFQVNQATINQVWSFIAPQDTPLSPPVVATIQNTEPQYQAPIVPDTSSQGMAPQADNVPAPQISGSVDPVAQIDTPSASVSLMTSDGQGPIVYLPRPELVRVQWQGSNIDSCGIGGNATRYQGNFGIAGTGLAGSGDGSPSMMTITCTGNDGSIVSAQLEFFVKSLN